MPFAKHSILYVDDDEGARLTLALLFGQQDYEVLAVGVSQGALFIDSDETFDLYILGPRLSRTDSAAFCRKIRQVERYAPIIIYSGSAGASEKDAEVCVGCKILSAHLGLDKLLRQVKAELEF